MNATLWVLQVLLAVHTVLGAVWKLGNSEQAVPSLAAIPHGGWLVLCLLEVACCVGLIAPAFNKRLARLIPLATGFLIAEMLLFTGVHLGSGNPLNGQVVYWAVVAAFCAFIAFGRLKLRAL